jgi:hypothetical protein
MHALATPTPPPQKVDIWSLKVARDTLSATREALMWAEIAAAAAIIALASSIYDNVLNRRQIRELDRKPKLTALCSINGTPQRATIDGGETSYYRFFGHLIVDVLNSGNRTSNGVIAEIWIPLKHVSPDGRAGPTSDDPGTNCEYLTVSISNSIYPRGPSVKGVVAQTVTLLSQTPTVQYYWRLSDEYDSYPSSGFGNGIFNLEE